MPEDITAPPVIAAPATILRPLLDDPTLPRLERLIIEGSNHEPPVPGSMEVADPAAHQGRRFLMDREDGPLIERIGDLTAPLAQRWLQDLADAIGVTTTLDARLAVTEHDAAPIAIDRLHDPIAALLYADRDGDHWSHGDVVFIVSVSSASANCHQVSITDLSAYPLWKTSPHLWTQVQTRVYAWLGQATDLLFVLSKLSFRLNIPAPSAHERARAQRAGNTTP